MSRYKAKDMPKGWAIPKEKPKAKAKSAPAEVTMGGTVSPRDANSGGGAEVTMGGQIRPPKPKKPKKANLSVMQEAAQRAGKKSRYEKQQAYENSARGKAEAADTNANLDAYFAKEAQQAKDDANDKARSTATHKYQTIRGGDYQKEMSKNADGSPK